MLCNITEWLGVDISFTDKGRDNTWKSHSWFIPFYISIKINKGHNSLIFNAVRYFPT